MTNDLLNFSKLPIDFQEGLFKDISTKINKGESVQLYGAPGSGNSLVAKVLMQSQEIKDKYFAKNSQFLLIDANLLLERSTLGLSRFVFALLTAGKLLDSDSTNLYSMIEDQVQNICRQKKLVIIIDHMQELDSPELKSFFVNLYNIYRKLEPKLGFIFIFNQRVEQNEDVRNFGLMGRLITQNVYKTPVFNKSDATWFIQEKEKQIGKKLSDFDRTEAIRLSGGYPRTLKRISEAVSKGIKLKELTENPAVDLALKLHFEELRSHLEEIPDIPLLESYLLVLERGAGESFGEIRLTQNLTKNEEKVLKNLLKNKGSIVEREKGIEALWGENGLEVSDHAYDQIIHRLRCKLKGSTPKAEIQTVRGRGHCLNY